MPFDPKTWVGEPDPLGPPANPAVDTPLDADALNDLEARIAAAIAATDSDLGDAVDALVAALVGKQAADSDLTAIAALSTTAFGRALLELVDAGAGRTALGAAAQTDLETLDELRLNMLGEINQVVVYGNSIPAGGGVSSPDRDIFTRFAQELKAKEVNYAKGGVVACWQNDIARGEFGLWAQVLQTHKRTIRPASTLNADPAVGATSVTLAHTDTSATGKAFKLNAMLHVGSGDPGAGGGEIIVAAADQAGAGLNLKANEGWEQPGAAAGLLRDHAVGDPVYEVPSHYGASNTIFFVCEMHNHLGHYGLTVASKKWWQDAMRVVLARLRSAEVFEPDHAALKFSGTWSAAVLSPGSSSGSTAQQGIRATTAVNSAVEFHLPNNFPGGTAALSFITGSGAGGNVWRFSVDGAVLSGEDYTVPATPTLPALKNVSWCKRFTGLSAGRHILRAEIVTKVDNGSYFDFAAIEADEPPVIVFFKAHRFYHWAFYGAGWEYGHLRTTLSSQANAGGSSISVAQSDLGGGRQIDDSPQYPAAGDTITLAPGTANEETKTVTTVAGSGPFTINFSGTLAHTHASGVKVEGGIKDSDLPTMNGWADELLAEFDSAVIPFDPDPAINKQRRLFNAADLVHCNDEGHAVMTDALYRQLADSDQLTPTVFARQTRPLPQPSSSVSIIGGGNTVVTWTGMPLALSEFPLATTGPGTYRRQADLSRVYEARIGCVQTVLGSAGAKLRLQYSLDGGATWFHLFRKLVALTDPTGTDWSEPSTSAHIVAEIDLNASITGALTNKVSIWQPIYPDAQADVLLRAVGIGGNGTADPKFQALWVECR